MAKSNRTKNVVTSIIAIAVCAIAWPVVSKFSASQITPIGSSIATVAGVLLGFVMASITMFGSVKDNTLIRNTKLTGYFPKLVNRLHVTMGLLLAVCFIYTTVLFLPDDLTFAMNEEGNEYKYSSVLMILGIFFLVHSSYSFFLAWRGFKEFVENM